MDLKLLKELRKRTDASMLLCKQALIETNNNIEESIVWLRKKNIIRSSKSLNRTVGEKAIFMHHISNNHILLLTVCVETDFVLRNEKLSNAINKLLLNSENEQNIEAVRKSSEDEIKELSGLLGEKIELQAFYNVKTSKYYGIYTHKLDGLVKSCVFVNADITWNGNQSDDIVAKLRSELNSIAVHITALSPKCLKPEELDADFVSKEKEIFLDSHKNKPENIQERIWNGKKQKLFEEYVLMKQKMIQDETISVEEYIAKLEKENNCKITITNFQIIK